MRRTLGAFLIAAAGQAFAQCSMCRTAAAAQAQAAGTINTAIVILLVPALVLFSGVFLLVFRSAAPEEREDRQP